MVKQGRVCLSLPSERKGGHSFVYELRQAKRGKHLRSVQALPRADDICLVVSFHSLSFQHPTH